MASWTTIVLIRAFYPLLRPVAQSLALLALLWRTVEATLGGMAAVTSCIALENLQPGVDAPGNAWRL